MDVVALPAVVRRFAFGVYAGFLFVMTHWPRIAIPAPGRWDLLVHASVFGGWAAMLIVSGIAPVVRSRRSVVRAIPVAIAYACFDEGLQAIPQVRRVAAWDDLAANITGILLVALAAWRWTRTEIAA